MNQPFDATERALIADAIAQGRVRRITWEECLGREPPPAKLCLGPDLEFARARLRHLERVGIDIWTATQQEVADSLNAAGYKTFAGRRYTIDNVWTFKQYLKRNCISTPKSS